MKEKSLIFGLIILISGLALASSLLQEVDLSGTWEGTAEVPDAQDLDRITLVLERTDGTYTGTITDTVGYAKESELEDVEFKENKLSFNFSIFNGTEYQLISATLTVEGNRMTGSWQNDEGNSGLIVLEKVKQNIF